MDTYTYIIAPNVANNFTILLGFMELFPEIVQQQRLKTIYKNSADDITGEDFEGGTVLLAPADGQSYILLKVLTEGLNPAYLSGVQDYELYTVDNLPFETYWL
jgi:hypothetical protein